MQQHYALGSCDMGDWRYTALPRAASRHSSDDPISSKPASAQAVWQPHVARQLDVIQAPTHGAVGPHPSSGPWQSPNPQLKFSVEPAPPAQHGFHVGSQLAFVLTHGL